MQNSGSLIWEFPSSFYGNPGPCGRTYQFYVESLNQPAWTYGPHFLVVCEIPIAMSIEPGSFPNSINPRSRVIPVAILTTDTFDATSVDTSTVFFGPTGIEAAPVHAAIEDVNGDGRPDMILHFKTQATGIQCGDTSAFLTGQTFSRQPIEGSNSINTVGCK